MARFPYYKKNVAALGKLLADARTNPELRSELKDDPNTFLAEIGLPANVTELVDFEVLDGAGDDVVVLPYRLNNDKLERKDPNYLREVARLFVN